MIKVNKARGGFRIVVTGNNNEVLITSEVIKNRQDALSSILALREQMLAYDPELGTPFEDNTQTKTKHNAD